MAKIPKKILLVDDEVLIRRVLNRFLTREGYVTFEATTLKTAIEMFRKHRPFDALLCDISLLDGSSGWDVVEKVRFYQPTIPVAVISGDLSIEVDPELAPVSILYKPFTPDGLRKLLEELWASRE
jgi:CheY-like chemotaxis protein